jgi:hypothetical protein
MDAFAILARTLTEAGLGSLFSVDSNGNPGGWLWDQIKSGVETEERLLVALEQTPEFRDRFKVIFDLRERSNRGESVTVPTVQNVLEYEQQYRSVMSKSGVPAWFYDSPQDAQDAMRNNLSVEQVKERIDESYSVINTMPREVRELFGEYFDDSSDSALVAAVLDPEKTLASLQKATRAAVAGGFARRQGFELVRSQANEYATLGRSPAQIEADIANVAQLRPLQDAQMGEAETIGDDSAFRAGALGDVESQRQLEGRLTTRRQGQAQSAGGAMTLNEGIVGAGVAR